MNRSVYINVIKSKNTIHNISDAGTLSIKISGGLFFAPWNLINCVHLYWVSGIQYSYINPT